MKRQIRHTRRQSVLRRQMLALCLLFLPLLVWLLLAISSTVLASENRHTTSDNRTFRATAAEILGGLKATEMGRIPAAAGYGAPRIAIKPFATARHDISLEEANGFNRRLLAELQRQGRPHFRFVARDAQADLVQEIENSGDGDPDQRLQALRANLRADILIIGRLSREHNETLLSYLVVGAETGDLFVSTTPRVVRPEPSRPLLHSTASPDPDADTALGAAVDTPADEPYRRSVEETEALLAELGYFPGAIDGILTEQTRRALRAYQSDSALPVNGRMTRRVVENMRRDTRLPY